MLELAGEAYARHAWGEAYAQLCAADAEASLDAEELERLAIAAHCLGRRRVDRGMGAGVRRLPRRRDRESAALAAAWCSFGLITRGEFALGSGWLGARPGAVRGARPRLPGAMVRASGRWRPGAMFGGDFGAALRDVRGDAAPRRPAA